MNTFEFIEYSAKRYGIDDSVAETMVDMFSSCLQELIGAGQVVEIQGIGTFEGVPIFPNGLNHQNNIALFKASKHHIVSFKASDEFINRSIAV